METAQDRGWCFIGMEYYALVLNRTFVIAINGGRLEGTQCRGLTSTAGGRDGLSRYINGKLAVHGDLEDPSTYMGERAFARRKRADFSLPLRIHPGGAAIRTGDLRAHPRGGGSGAGDGGGRQFALIEAAVGPGAASRTGSSLQHAFEAIRSCFTGIVAAKPHSIR